MLNAPSSLCTTMLLGCRFPRHRAMQCSVSAEVIVCCRQRVRLDLTGELLVRPTPLELSLQSGHELGMHKMASYRQAAL